MSDLSILLAGIGIGALATTLLWRYRLDKELLWREDLLPSYYSWLAMLAYCRLGPEATTTEVRDAISAKAVADFKAGDLWDKTE